MLSAYDKWKLATPPESNVPEMDDDDKFRILADILLDSFRRQAAHNVPAESVKQWIKLELLDDDTIFEALSDYHRKEIDRRWADEHSDPLDDGDEAYERSRDRD